MLFEDSAQDIALCSQLFPNLGWLIESDNLNRVLYEGKSNTPLTLQIEGSLEGYRAFLLWGTDSVLFSTDLPSTSLLNVLQEMRTEWHRIAEVMK